MEKIITFFQKYPLQTVKLLNFNDFVSIGNLMHNKEHLSKEGIKKIINIKKIKIYNKNKNESFSCCVCLVCSLSHTSQEQ